MSNTRHKWSVQALKKEAKKYMTRGEFSKSSRSAYNAATRLGVLNNICAHMKPLMRKWTKENIRNEATKHQTMSSFWQVSAAAVRAAKKFGMLEAVTSHMKEQRKPHGFWTEAAIFKEAKKYTSKKKFMSAAPGALVAAQRFKITKAVCSHMVGGKKPNGYWQNKDNIIKEVSKYGTRMEFRKRAASAAIAADQLGIFDEVTKHIPKVTNWKWTESTITKEAEKYTTLSDFKGKSGSAYNAARKLGFIDKIKRKLTSKKRSNRFWWDSNNLKQEARKYRTRKEFQVNSPGAYDRAFDQNVLDEICGHMKTPEFTAIIRYLYIFEFEDHSAYVGISYNPEERREAHVKGKRKGHEVSSLVHQKIKSGVPYKFIVSPEPLNSNQVASVEEKKIQEYKDKNWKMLNRAKGGSLGGKPIKWTNRTILKEAKKYRFRRDFRENSPGAYSRAVVLNKLQEVCAHMPRRAPNRMKQRQ